MGFVAYGVCRSIKLLSNSYFSVNALQYCSLAILNQIQVFGPLFLLMIPNPSGPLKQAKLSEIFEILRDSAVQLGGLLWDPKSKILL